MESWSKTCVILCLFGFFKDFKPSEPFLTQYLVEPQWVNITLTQAYLEVYPVWTYSYLAVLVLVFLLTDYVKYKPMIIFEGLAFVATWILLVFASGVQWMQLMQFFYGIATSTEVAYYAYIYSKVDEDKYQKVTSFTRAATLSAIFLSSITGQVLVTMGLSNYRQLNMISLGSVSVATFISFFLPHVKKTIYFHTQENEDMTTTETVFQRALRILKSNFKMSFAQGSVFRWSLWWALGMCLNYQVGNFIQPLWEHLHQSSGFEQGETWNGAVEAASTFGGAALTFAFGYIQLNWASLGEILLIIISFLDALILIAMGHCEDIRIAYIGYLLYRPLFQMLITVASFEIARQIKSECCGLVFGVNTFLALGFQSILTLVIVQELEWSPPKQFVAYGIFSLMTAILLFLVKNLSYLSSLCFPKESSSNEKVSEEIESLNPTDPKPQEYPTAHPNHLTHPMH